ncbi:MAG TPA: hypothetical protein D7H89_08300 [Candidatus Poseidoniales archaeon]|nr:MAG TPA: hypothetical protein D7H89_08300 [Candidatus Poseidoniales archaeon]HII87951.1 hypothetical protein [Candidatus Poseidoniaceae archaeon]
MKVKLNYTGTVDVYDVNTTYAASMNAPGLQRLCKWAEENGGNLSKESIQEEFSKLSPGAARNLFENGVVSGVWTDKGELTDEGSETASTGNVMIKEVGPLRIWVFNHPATGAVLLHADRLTGLPMGDATPQVDHPPKVLTQLSQNLPSTSLLSTEKKRWSLHWEKGAWASVEKYKTRAELNWEWNLSEKEGWVAKPTLSLRGTLMGTSKNKDQDGKSVQTTCDNAYEFEPSECIAKWLTQGRFSKSQWDASLVGMRRRFEELDTAERHRWTLNLALESDETGRWAGNVTIEDLPLYAYNNEDAAHWIQFLIREHVTGYTTAESVEQLLDEFVSASPFSWLDENKVSTHVHKLMESSRADQRLSKLLSAGDDLGSMAYVPQAIQQRQGGSGNLIHDGSDDFKPFVLALTENLGGQLKQISVVDRYVFRKKPIQKFGAFSKACREQSDDANVRLLTSEVPYLNMSKDYTEEQARKKYASKLKPYCDELLFMESTDGAKAPHNRYILVESSTETRFFEGADTLFQGTREKRFTQIDRVLEPDLFKHLKMTSDQEEEA